MKPLRRALHRFVPAHFQDPVGLARRLLRSRDPAARFAMLSAGLGLAAIPMDLVLALLERGRLRAAGPPQRPLLLICGPPRSGTTLLAQTLIQTLPVAFINNLTAVFPRAPLTANRIFLPGPPRRDVGFRSFYGRSRRWSGPNDGLHLWDRWVGSDRRRIPRRLDPAAQDAMRRFFGAMEAQYGMSVLAKNNSLIGYAHLVAPVLPTARFLCLTRNPVFLAQSLLRARREIHGRDDVPYGLALGVERADPVEDVCRQVREHEALTRLQQERIGSERFRSVSYEALCADPAAVVREISREVLAQPAAPDRLAALSPFTPSNRARLDAGELDRIRQVLERMPVPDTVTP